MPEKIDAFTAAHRLAHLLPRGAVSFGDADRFAASMDLWPRHMVRLYNDLMPTLPLAVVWPDSLDMLQEIICFAGDAGLPLVPYGAGSSVVGGASPNAGHVVLDLKRMSGVIAIDTAAHTVTAQCGILGERLERQLQRRGFSQGHFPSSIYCSTLGGWLAARSAGQMSSLYGKIEDQVLGGVAVLGDGSVLRQAPSVLRDPRFDALIGCEGTLGVLTQATLRIHPLPAKRWWRGFDFPSIEQALAAAEAWLRCGLSPSVVRIYDPLDTLLHRMSHGTSVPHDRGPSMSAAVGAHLPKLVGFVGDHIGGRCRSIVGLEGAEAWVDCDAATVLQIAGEHGATDCGPGPAEAWYARRYAVSYRLSNAFRAGVAADTMEVACLWPRLQGVYRAVKQAGRQAGAQVLAHFSHMYREGGSIYFTFALPAAGGEDSYNAMWEACLDAAVSAGANISHHHGVGQLKRRALHAAQGDAGAALRRMRDRCDPQQILNPESLAAESCLPAPPKGDVAEATGALVPLVAHLSLAAAEAQLGAEAKTLGPVAALWPHLSLLEAARRGLLWRHNGQFATLESLIAGVDTPQFHFLAAPRAAQGPDLLSELLRGEVSRVWVRCDELPSRHLQHVGTLDRCLRLAQQLLAHASGRGLCVGVQATSAREAVLFVTLPGDPGREALIVALMREVTGSAAFVLNLGAPLWAAIGDAQSATFLLGGAWQALREFASDAHAAGARLCLAWMEHAGAAGFVTCADATSHAALQLSARAKGLLPEAACEPPRIRTFPAAAPPAQPAAHAAVRLDPNPLRLRDHAPALDNCTYCPKLCRFSCPVAVEGATETTTPRQLMLTANLERTERQSLNADAIEQLYACVDCRGCRTFCDHDNDVATVLQAARAEIWEHGRAPHAVAHTLDAMIRHGALGGSHMPTLTGDGAAASTWLWLSCQHTPNSTPAQQGVLSMARLAHGQVHVWKPRQSVRCCGHPLWRWGAKAAFAAHAARFAASLEPHVRSLVVDDPGCAYTLGTLYKQVGVTLPPVQSAMALLTPQTQLSLPDHSAPHDACFERAWLGGPSMRASFPGAKWAKGSILEGEAGCCGGMLLPHINADLATRVAQGHAADLLGGGAQRIISASPTCSRRLRSVGAPVEDLWAHLKGKGTS